MTGMLVNCCDHRRPAACQEPGIKPCIKPYSKPCFRVRRWPAWPSALRCTQPLTHSERCGWVGHPPQAGQDVPAALAVQPCLLPPCPSSPPSAPQHHPVHRNRHNQGPQAATSTQTKNHMNPCEALGMVSFDFDCAAFFCPLQPLPPPPHTHTPALEGSPASGPPEGGGDVAAALLKLKHKGRPPGLEHLPARSSSLARRRPEQRARKHGAPRGGLELKAA